MTATGPTVTAFLFGLFGLLFRLAMFVQFLAGLDRVQSLGHQRFASPPASWLLRPRQPSRARIWSPTRMALAIAVRAGFTALMLGKMLVSAT